MKNIGKKEIAIQKAKDICGGINCVFKKDSIFQVVSASVGIALYLEHGMTYEELHYYSDTALYNGKKMGEIRLP
jgi:predicted signal transduction protein with EAL and GGDEF domain